MPLIVGPNVIFLHPTNNILLHHTSCFGFFSLYYTSLQFIFALSNNNYRSSTLNKFTVGNLVFPPTQPLPSHSLHCLVSNRPITECGRPAYTLKVHSWQPLVFIASPHLLSLIDSEQYKKRHYYTSLKKRLLTKCKCKSSGHCAALKQASMCDMESTE